MKRCWVPLCTAALFSIAGASVNAATSETDTEQRILEVQRLLFPPASAKDRAVSQTPLTKWMARLNVPGVSVAVIHEGRIEWARGFGVTHIGGPPVTENTLFQAASISKPVFALAMLHEVDTGKLTLDTNVNDYLKTWKLPENEFTRDQKVTLRRLLSHTAGLTVHGFPGYEAGAQLPTTIQILDGALPANNPAIRVDSVPGSKHRYSGGGYVVAQLLLADVTGEPLPKVMQDLVLGPLGLTHSTFEQPLPAARMVEVALPYRPNGKPVRGGPHVYPEIAAAGLWTTPSDLARFALGLRDALSGRSSVISAATARAMLTPVYGDAGIGIFLGGSTSRKLFAHNGGNEGYRCSLVAYEDGEGAVIMTSGDRGDEIAHQLLRTIAQVYDWPDYRSK